MLVLSREKDESLVIAVGNISIEVAVLRTGSKVKLGISAPADVKVIRKELIGRQVDCEA